MNSAQGYWLSMPLTLGAPSLPHSCSGKVVFISSIAGIRGAAGRLEDRSCYVHAFETVSSSSLAGHALNGISCTTPILTGAGTQVAYAGELCQVAVFFVGLQPFPLSSRNRAACTQCAPLPPAAAHAPCRSCPLLLLMHLAAPVPCCSCPHPQLARARCFRSLAPWHLLGARTTSRWAVGLAEGVKAAVCVKPAHRNPGARSTLHIMSHAGPARPVLPARSTRCCRAPSTHPSSTPCWPTHASWSTSWAESRWVRCAAGLGVLRGRWEQAG